jgi:hypothetical protein
MIPQGWPLWAVRKATGTIYAVVGWDGWQNSTGMDYRPVVVELGCELDGPAAGVADGGLTFVPTLGDARLRAAYR